MDIYISFLRGINVSGKNRIKIDELKDLYEAIGFRNIKTYIQSGNVIFTSKEQNIDDRGTAIKEQIRAKYGYNVEVFVRTPSELKKIIDSAPVADKDISKFHVTFLSSVPSVSQLENIMKKKSETEFILIDKKTVYLYCPDGYGKTKLSNNFLEKKLNVSATTRNWKTVNKLIELAANLIIEE